MTPRFPFCCFFRFQSPRSLRIDCHQSLSGLFLPLSMAPARPRRTSGFTVGWSFSARGFRRFPFCCYRTPGYRRIPFTFTPFFSFPRLSPDLSLFLFLGCECQLTQWSPELGQRVVPPFRRFYTATVVSRPRRPFLFLQASPLVSLLSPLSKKYHGYFISRSSFWLFKKTSFYLLKKKKL